MFSLFCFALSYFWVLGIESRALHMVGEIVQQFGALDALAEDLGLLSSAHLMAHNHP